MLVLTQAIGIAEGFEVSFVIASIFSEPLNLLARWGNAQIFCHTEVRKIFALGW